MNRDKNLLWKALERDAKIRKARMSVILSPAYFLRHRSPNSRVQLQKGYGVEKPNQKGFQMTLEVSVDKDSTMD